jgi:DNA polymerase-3 subunit delta'
MQYMKKFGREQNLYYAKKISCKQGKGVIKMGFEEIIGQDLIIIALRRSLSNGQTTHAYLFSGPDGSGKKSLALLFAQALNCSSELDPPCNSCLSCRKTLSGNHPDFYQLRPEGASIKIGQLRELKESLYYFPREGRKKVCLIHSADLMTLPAANSLLQILEEPPADLIFILLSSRPGLCSLLLSPDACILL